MYPLAITLQPHLRPKQLLIYRTFIFAAYLQASDKIYFIQVQNWFYQKYIL